MRQSLLKLFTAAAMIVTTACNSTKPVAGPSDDDQAKGPDVEFVVGPNATRVTIDQKIIKIVGQEAEQGASLAEAMKNAAVKKYIAKMIRFGMTIEIDRNSPVIDEMLRDTKVSEVFQSNGLPQASMDEVQERLNKHMHDEVMKLTPTERAAFVIQPLNGTNRWPEFKKADGTTVIPVSFGKPVDGSNKSADGVVINRYVKKPTVLSPQEQTLARRALWSLPQGTCASFQEVSALPKIENTAHGVLDFKDDLSDVPISNDENDPRERGEGGHEINSPSNARADVVIDKTQTSYLSIVEHETGHALGLAHPFNPNTPFRLDGTRNASHQHTVPGINTDITIMAYDGSAFDPITPMAADTLALQSTYGTCFASDNAQTYTLKEGNQDQIVASRDPRTVWLSPGTQFAQAIAANEADNTLDFSSIDGKPVELSPLASIFTGSGKVEQDSTLDLGRMSNTLQFYFPDANSAFGTIYLSTLGNIPNATLTGGNIKAAAGDGTIEVKLEGTLDASREGGQTLIGGTRNTNFVGGPGHKTFIIHAGTADNSDSIRNYKPDQDRIKAPEGTAKAVYSNVNRGPETAAITQGALSFFSSNSDRLKTVYLEQPLTDAQIAALDVETPEGQRLAVGRAYSELPPPPPPIRTTAPPPQLPPEKPPISSQPPSSPSFPPTAAASDFHVSFSNNYTNGAAVDDGSGTVQFLPWHIGLKRNDGSNVALDFVGGEWLIMVEQGGRQEFYREMRESGSRKQLPENMNRAAREVLDAAEAAQKAARQLHRSWSPPNGLQNLRTLVR